MVSQIEIILSRTLYTILLKGHRVVQARDVRPCLLLVTQNENKLNCSRGSSNVKWIIAVFLNISILWRFLF
jgi:hypothetical protein